jgi:hypothetical protein
MGMRKIVTALSAALLVGLMLLSGTASASTFTISFTGTVTAAFDRSTFNDVPGELGKSVSGDIKFNGTSAIGSPPPSATEFVTYDHTDWSLTVGSEPTLSGSTSQGAITVFGSGPEAVFDAGSGPIVMELDLAWIPSSQLLTLATFPANDAAAVAFFGAPLSSKAFNLGSPTGYNFDITSFTASTVASTPLPASAWFLMTALGGLGWVASRRRAPTMALTAA